jgi:hypothetical protein
MPPPGLGPRRRRATLALVPDRPVLENDSPRSRRLVTSARLILACRAALERMAQKDGPEDDIFAETGEALCWLYSLGSVGVPYGKPSNMSRGLHWARNRYGHGQLVSWPVAYDAEGAALDRRFIREDGRLDPHHCWLPRSAIVWDDINAHPDPDGEQAYDADVAGRAVAVTLRAELGRLVMLIGRA